MRQRQRLPRDGGPQPRELLPQLGKGLGQGLRNFKDSVKGDEPPPADKKP